MNDPAGVLSPGLMRLLVSAALFCVVVLALALKEYRAKRRDDATMAKMDRDIEDIVRVAEKRHLRKYGAPSAALESKFPTPADGADRFSALGAGSGARAR